MNNPFFSITGAENPVILNKNEISGVQLWKAQVTIIVYLRGDNNIPFKFKSNEDAEKIFDFIEETLLKE